MRMFIALIIACISTAYATDSDAPVLSRFTADFTSEPNFNKDWHVDDGWTIGGVVNTDWRKSQVRIADKALQFVLQKDTTTKTGYASGSIVTRSRFHHGYFEASLKAAKGDGIVTGFFTYIGQPGRENEIDVEILGRDTRRAQFTYHVDGKDSGGVTVDLPFDAAESYHVFGFDWQPTYIRWYADGRLMAIDDGQKLPLPSRPTQVMIDLWNGNGVDMDSWLKPFRWQDKPFVASVRCVAYRQQFNGVSDCATHP